MRLAAQPAQCRRPALVGVQSHRQSDRKVSESAVARGGRVEVAQRPLTSRRLRPRRCRRVPRLLQRETVGAQLLRYRPGTHPVAKAQARDAHRVPRVPVCPHGETRPRRRRKKHQSRASHRLGLQISLLEKRQVFVHIALGVMAEAEMPGIAQNLPMTALHPPAADLRRWMVSCADLAQADLRVADHVDLPWRHTVENACPAHSAEGFLRWARSATSRVSRAPGARARQGEGAQLAPAKRPKREKPFDLLPRGHAMCGSECNRCRGGSGLGIRRSLCREQASSGRKCTTTFGAGEVPSLV